MSAPDDLVHARYELGHDWAVDMWEQPVRPGAVSFDASLVARHDGMLRLAVMDGAMNPLAPDCERLTLTGVHTIRGWLSTVQDVEAAIAGATGMLHNPDMLPRHRNPIAAVAVADLDPSTGALAARRYADCEVWVMRDGTWVSLFPGDMLTGTARAAYEAGCAGAPSSWEVQEATLDDPSAWNTTPVGLVLSPRAETTHVGLVEEVIVSSDGARLTPERCANLSEWLTVGIQHLPEGWPYPFAHGDLTVLHAYRDR